MKDYDRIVYRDEDGQWINKRLDADRASSLHSTQGEAEAAARGMLKNSGGGELITKGLNGQIRSKDTIAPARDPYPPKDKGLAVNNLSYLLIDMLKYGSGQTTWITQGKAEQSSSFAQ